MEKPSKDIIDRVINNKGTHEEAISTVKWFATTEGSSYLEERMDNEYLEEKNRGLEKQLYNSIQSRIRKKEKYSTLFKVAAVLIPLIFSLVFVWHITSKINLLGDAPVETIVTRTKEKTHLVFQDGTEVFISPETTLDFPKKFGLSERKISLNGEAYFKVAKNSNRPFIIEMKGTSIKVLGTSFFVKSYDKDEEIDIILEEGSIDFRIGDDRNNVLIAGQQLKYNKVNNELVVKETNNVDNYNNWKNNTIIFNNDGLKNVLKTLSRWYDKKFVIEDKSIIKFTYTTTFYDASLTDILEEMEEVSPIKFSIKGDTIFVSHRK